MTNEALANVILWTFLTVSLGFALALFIGSALGMEVNRLAAVFAGSAIALGVYILTVTLGWDASTD